ncbi:hypothetical protein BDQ12DRAFT_755204 [Crucibulum laeve]|uniref:Protein kinase domain-containing protein n=1 Tax=Crucibulum laeve TaxID=68775 RepID=A0A5C3LTK8_9AGAR|nr:hypothetical protein BDQ12DRAFT_755204 [Crucibulum laeve]
MVIYSARSTPPSGCCTPTRPRGISDSALLGMPACSDHLFNRLISASKAVSSHSSDFPSDTLRPSFRQRSRSVNQGRESPKGKMSDSVSGSEPASWWNRIERIPRSWGLVDDDSDVPDEQKEGWKNTRKAVAQAAVSVLGTAGLMAKEGLTTGLELLEFVPLPGLQPVASTLLKIWEAVQLVDMNRLASLRLTNRCADMLLSIRQDIAEASDMIDEELSRPIEALNQAFLKVQILLESQSRSPFLKRYLKRKDMAGEITSCGDDLLNALRMFGVSVQIRTLKLVQMSEQRRQADAKILHDVVTNLSLSPCSCSPLSMDTTIPSLVIPALKELHSKQNFEDADFDTSDMRHLMRCALQTGSDADLVAFLQIVREEMPEAIKSLQRALESSSSTLPSAALDRDALHQEFMESGIDALRRLSQDVADSVLPAWTITKYEVHTQYKVGIGFFSDVFKGTWKGRTVAIKVLADTTPRKLFLREMDVWQTLKHPHVLELYGASSASGDPPWFFVSPYEKNGTLVEFLKQVAMQEHRLRMQGSSTVLRRNNTRWSSHLRLSELDLYRFMKEVAEGMEYLHSQGILHGDLKASNVLIDDGIHCVISDFGQSEMKSEVHRISGLPFPRGTLRWQAPELMSGFGQLTPATDVYAYAISCIEILSMGQMPWSLMDDAAVRYLVLKEDNRPPIPPRCSSAQIQQLISVCWDEDPSARPAFPRIAIVLDQAYSTIAKQQDEIRSPRIPEIDDSEYDRPRPRFLDLCPQLPEQPFSSQVHTALECTEDGPQIPSFSAELPCREETDTSEVIRMPEPVFYTPSLSSSWASSSIFSHSQWEEDYMGFGVYDPVNISETKASDAKDERVYRLLVDRKDYHSSLCLPLWSPVPVKLGAVGYLSKPCGTFVTLFNAFKPHKSSRGLTGDMPSVAGYGIVYKGSQKQDKRNAARRGLDAVAGLLTFRNRGDIAISRRYSFPLCSGRKAAYICVETTEYQFLKKLEAPKMWFKANMDSILKIYGSQHGLQKEDLLFVIGALQTPNYGLFVSHNHPDSQAHFNVYSSTKKGEPWGTFTTDSKVSLDLGGPFYDEPMNGWPKSSNKVSSVGGDTCTVLIARLRFKPDALEPTSL